MGPYGVSSGRLGRYDLLFCPEAPPPFFKELHEAVLDALLIDAFFALGQHLHCKNGRKEGRHAYDDAEGKSRAYYSF